jgi:GT2 family glycosyltransferase
MQPGIRSAIGHFLFVNRFLPGDRGGRLRGFQVRATTGSTPRQVEWASAAVLLARASAIRSVGGFDPSIFMYGEDVELCGRLVEAGWTVWLAPAAIASHAIAGSQGGVTARWVDGLHRLHARRAGRASIVVLDLIIAAGLGTRAVAELVAGRGDGCIAGG